MAIRSPEHPAPSHFLLHLSDLHLRGEESPPEIVDGEVGLLRVLAEIEATGARPEAIVFSGDLANSGEPKAYARLRAAVEPVAERLGARTIWAMGNHDDRANLREHLLGEPRSDEPLNAVHWLGGLRVIVLDTSVPGAHHGEISAEQLEWLGRGLEVPAPEGTLLVMHHPPVPCIQPLAILVELRGQAGLAAVVRGSDVRAILGGHLHYSTSATFAGIPVSVASSTCYTQDLAGPVDPLTGIRGTRGRDAAQGCTMVHVYRDTVVHSVVPPAGGATVGEEFTPAAVARTLHRHGALPPWGAPGSVRTR